jgi:hypothetical protein
MADPDASLANGALGKIASGKALSELSPSEQQAVGALPPTALQAAMGKRIAPKPALKEQYSSPGPGASGVAPKPASDSFVSTNYEGQSKPLAAGASEPKAPGAYQPPVTAIDRAYNDAVAARDALKPAQEQAANNAQVADSFLQQAIAPRAKRDPVGAAVQASVGSSNSPIRGGTGAPIVLPRQGQSGVLPVISTPPPALITKNKGPALVASATPPETISAGYRPGKAYDVPTSSAPIIPKDIKGPDLANIIGSVLQVLGSGGMAYAGRYVPTLKTQQLESEMRMKEAQKQADIDYENKIRLIPVEAQNAIAQARSIGDIQSEQAIATQYGIEKKIEPIKTREIIAGKRPPIGNFGLAGQQYGSGGQ